ncbi:MAG: hypothetical protein ACFFCM_03290 [Promethearchaeota archaeon]
MDNKYLYVLITLIIWFVLDLICLLVFPDYMVYFISSLILLGANLTIFVVGYVNYKLHEKPYSIMYFINSCPLILSLFYNLEGQEIFIFFVVPIILGIIFMIVLAITKRLGGFEFDKITFLKYFIIIPLFYAAILVITIIYGILGISEFPILFGFLIYPLNFIFLIILIGTAR